MLNRTVQGHVLRQFRQAKGMTLREVSAKGHLALGHLSDVERGVKEISSELLGQVTDALDIEMEELLTEMAKEYARG